MRKATENQGNPRTFTEYLMPRSKVKDFTLQQSSLPHVTSFYQETPMKPSQVHNWLFHPPPRRMLPLQSPEQCHRDRLGPPQPSPRPAGPVHSSVPNSPVNFGSWVNRPLPPPSPGRLQHSGQSPGPIYSSQLSPVSPTNIGASYNGPQPSSPTIFNPASPYSRKDVSSHSDIRRDQVTANMVALSNSGTKNATVQQQESTKAQSNDIRSPIQTIQLHRPPTTLSVATRTVKDVCSQRDCQLSTSDQSSDRSSGSCSPMMHSPAPPYQDQHHRRTPSNETFIPVVDLNCTSQKRNREPEDCDDTAKKLCLQAAHSGIAQTPKPTVANSLSSSLVAPSRNSSVLELSPKSTDTHLRAEPACGQTCLEQSSTFKPNQSSCASPSPKPCVKRQTPRMAQQVFLNHTENHVVKLTDLRADREILMKIGEENDRGCKSSTLLSSEVPQKHAGSSSHAQLGSHYSCHTQNNTSASPVRTHNRVQQIEESRALDNNTLKPASKSNSGSLTCRSVERNKMIRPRKPVVLPNDIDELFTPDPKTYVVIPTHKNAKPKVDVGPIKSPSESCSSNAVVISSAPVTGSLCHKAQTSTATGPPHAEVTTVSFSSAHCPQILLPAVSLERVKLENLMSFCPKDSKLKNSSITSLSSQLKDKSVKTDEKHKSHLPNYMRPCALKTDTAASEQTYTSCCFPSAPLEKEASEGDREQVNKEDPIDVELDLGLSFALDLDLTQSSHSSDEEQLLSFQEIMDRVTKPPDTPEKGTFSEPSTPGHHNCQSKTLPLPSTAKSVIYKNNLDQMLKEINTNKKAKEIEMQLLTACKEDLLRIAEYEEAEEEEGISTEQQEFLQRYSLMSSAIKEVPPGEVVFNLQKFGQIFNQDTLELRRCMANPQGAAQKTLLWSSSAQFRLHVNIGLFQEAYNYHSPCPTQVTRFLFKMMSVHTERMVSEKILQALCDIACTAACQIVEKRSQLFKVWVPSLADVTLVLMNMGVAFVTLFPFENLQPPFTEGELLEDVYIKRESPSSNKEQDTFPEHNCNNILKYLHYCMGLCPRAYSDVELLLLLTVVCRMGLDTRLILRSRVDFYPLQHKIVNNIRHWDTMLPRICLALTDLTCDHHNMCLLVQLLPDNTRGKQLRRHLSLSMISKLLDGTCTYRPTEKELQLCELRPYLHRMQPSTLLRGMLSSSSRSQKEKDEDMAILDQQAYYLCYSLLTLANEASDFPFFPAQQKKHLLSLCSELETHVKCDIRESEKCLYRSKVKDLVARIYTKWQMLLQRTRPLNGKLYDYWEPPVETLTSSQEEQETDNSDDEEGKVIEENPAMEDDEEKETSGVEENVVSMVPEEEEEEEKKGGDTIDDTNKTEDNMTQDERLEEMEGCKTINNTNKTEDGMTQDERLEDIEGGDAINDTSETDKAIEPVPEALMDEKIDTDNAERTEAETEHLGEKKNFSP